MPRISAPFCIPVWSSSKKTSKTVEGSALEATGGRKTVFVAL